MVPDDFVAVEAEPSWIEEEEVDMSSADATGDDGDDDEKNALRLRNNADRSNRPAIGLGCATEAVPVIRKLVSTPTH